ncbi:hypothetical protein EJ04DRAFT_519531 [Polyplosphaeria fusca]|uniref:DASH complex subunit SPC34 n=1 Tax=Polyplosphaeria fusca TaxID=682080 RepID=A0A9P4V7M6_9PLEO|nr:hypothetical protein EJ04DRAFT_519531 [Polyplosphaeria fusca]
MTLLDKHLDQISYCAASISELPFPRPKIFTNALLQAHDITSLIRDTEIHERALFSVPPPPPAPKAQNPSASTNRRNTIFDVNGAGSSTMGGGANAVRAPKRNTAVAAVLGTELVDKIRKGGGGGAGTGMGYRTYDNTSKTEVDVETLLEGAEKLLAVYPIPGAREKISALRQRHMQLESSLDYYENKIADQTTQLAKKNRPRSPYIDDEPDEAEGDGEAPVFQPMTDEDLRKEEEEVRTLEQKKRGLEDRVNSMGRDISGVLRLSHSTTMIDFTLTSPQLTLRTNARTFANSVLAGAPKLYSHLPTQNERFQATLPIYRTAVQAGLIKGQVPSPLGGTSESLVDAAIVVEEFFAVEPSAAITILGTGLGLTPLILGGNEELWGKFLKKFLVQEGEPIAAFVHSEPGGTANWLEKGAPGLGTTAYEEGGEWVLNGEKLWTTNSSGWDNRGADIQCVVCRQGRPNEPQDPNVDPASNILILIVTREDISHNDASAYQVLSDPELPGFTSANGPHSKFTNLRIPSSNLLCAPGKGAQIVEQTFGSSAALVGAMCVGIMRSAFDAALAFCKTDTRGGTVPIIQHQSVADKLIDIKMRVEAARALTWKALSGIEKGPGGWENRIETALEAKVWCSEQVTKCVVDAMSVVGMRSYEKSMGFSRMLDDAVCLPLFDGGNVGVRRRQLEKIFQSDGYEPWAGTYSSS